MGTLSAPRGAQQEACQGSGPGQNGPLNPLDTRPVTHYTFALLCAADRATYADALWGLK
jgi:hypothetical protein